MDEAAHRPLQGGYRLGHPEAKGQALDRPDRWPDAFGYAAQEAGPAAGGHHHRPGGTGGPTTGLHPDRSPVPDGDRGDPVVDQVDAVGPAGDQEGFDHPPVVDLVVVGQVGAAPDAGSQEWFVAAAVRGRQRSGRQSPSLPIGQQVVGGGLVGGIDRHHQGAARRGSGPGCPDAASRVRAKSGHARAAARLRVVRASSPKWASPTGASMPAAAQLAARPGRGSTTVTVIPARAACQATASPMTPAPTTTTSGA